MKNIKGTDFQKKVWLEISKIPKGKTISYKELAIKIGKPKAYIIDEEYAQENNLGMWEGTFIHPKKWRKLNR